MAAKNFRLLKTTFLLSMAFFILVVFSFPCKICFATALDTDTAKPFLSTEALTSPDKLQSDPKAEVLNLAEARFKQGQWEEAGRYARQLLAMEPGNAKAQGILGTVYAITGNKEAAQKVLQSAVKISKNFKGADHAQELLNKISQ